MMPNDTTAKSDAATPEVAAPVPAATPAAAFDLTLDEFCSRLSLSDKRVELIGAFHSDETRAGKVKDTEAAFADRYAAFVKKPA